ncbi:MAG TPA: hypothetical protein VI953_04350 [Candidatus Paceibacterota bacterium]
MRQIVFLPHFLRQLKPLLKKFPDLKNSVADTLDNFTPETHILIAEDIYKVRLSTKSLKRGKSGGFRLYTYFFELNERIVPITIYFKGDKDNLTANELGQHAQIILSELQVTS